MELLAHDLVIGAGAVAEEENALSQSLRGHRLGATLVRTGSLETHQRRPQQDPLLGPPAPALEQQPDVDLTAFHPAADVSAIPDLDVDAQLRPGSLERRHEGRKKVGAHRLDRADDESRAGAVADGGDARPRFALEREHLLRVGDERPAFLGET